MAAVARVVLPEAFGPAERGFIVLYGSFPALVFGLAAVVFVALKIRATTGRPKLLCAHCTDSATAKRGLAFRVRLVIPAIFRFVIGFVVAVLDFQLPRNVIVSLVEKPDKPIDLVPGFPAELADCDKDLFGGDVRWEIQRILGVLWPSWWVV